MIIDNLYKIFSSVSTVCFLFCNSFIKKMYAERLQNSHSAPVCYHTVLHLFWVALSPRLFTVIFLEAHL